MELLLNDQSYQCNGKLCEHWEAISCFGILADRLKEYGVDKIVCPQGYKSLPLGGVTWKDCYLQMEELNDDQRMEIVTLMDSTLREARPDELDANTVFCEEADFSNPSAALGKACTDDRPVVSFTFRKVDKRDTIEGFLRAGTGKKVQKATVKNLYRAETGQMAVCLTSLKECKRKNPEKEPLWNQEMVTKYLSRIGHEDNRHSASTEEKQAYLIEHATQIALMNGWCLHTRLSRINSNNEQKRVIFYSKAFKNTATYLCIDLEHEDIRFELCDYAGRHLKEIKHNGQTTDATPQRSHNIKV